MVSAHRISPLSLASNHFPLPQMSCQAKSEHRRQLKAVLASRQPDRSHRLQLLLEEALGKGFDLPDVAGPRVAVEIMDSLKRLRCANVLDACAFSTDSFQGRITHNGMFERALRYRARFCSGVVYFREGYA